MFEKCWNLLNSRGVTQDDMVELVFFLQSKYSENLTREEVYSALDRVMHKREVQNAIITGIALDLGAEKRTLEDPELTGILRADEGLYGIDEVIGFGICNLYGSIALTSYGYIDKLKPGILEKINEKHPGVCNTYLDDIVGAIAACAASSVAHNRGFGG